jgi:hypothetical protein
MPSPRASLIFIPGLLLTLPAATPAFAATFDAPPAAREMILVGSLLLLGVALAMRIGQRWQHTHRTPEGPDLRWWRNS